jgi:hypothetical protein
MKEIFSNLTRTCYFRLADIPWKRKITARIPLEWTMGQGIDSHTDKLSLQMRVPVVLDLIVRSTRQSTGYQRPLISKECVQFENKIVFVLRKTPTFQIRAKIIYPSQPATLATPKKTCGLRE